MMMMMMMIKKKKKKKKMLMSSQNLDVAYIKISMRYTVDMTATRTPHIILDLSGGAVPDDADALGDATAVDGIAAGRWGSKVGRLGGSFGAAKLGTMGLPLVQTIMDMIAV